MASFGPDQDLQWVAANLAVLHQAALPRRTPGRVQRFHRNKGLPGSCLPCPVVLAFRQEGCRIPPFAGEHELLEGFALPWSQVALLEIVRQRGGITFVADRNSGPCLVAFRDSKDFARLVGKDPDRILPSQEASRRAIAGASRRSPSMTFGGPRRAAWPRSACNCL